MERFHDILPGSFLWRTRTSLISFRKVEKYLRGNDKPKRTLGKHSRGLQMTNLIAAGHGLHDRSMNDPD